MPDLFEENRTEKKESMEDNARKFSTEPIDQAFLESNKASSFELISDWLVTDEDSEKKLAYKKYLDGNVQILLISKTVKDGNRVSEKVNISEEEYARLVASSILRLEKKRSEFSLVQSETSFILKYDEFAGSDLRVLEVDATSEQERSSFNPANFPYKLTEVTGDQSYYGYRVSTKV